LRFKTLVTLLLPVCHQLRLQNIGHTATAWAAGCFETVLRAATRCPLAFPPPSSLAIWGGTPDNQTKRQLANVEIYVFTYVIDVKISHTPEEGVHGPSWPNGIIIIIIIDKQLKAIVGN
jgi:hypothetical protein